MESNANQCRCPERYPQPWKAPLISLIGLAFVVLVVILVVRYVMSHSFSLAMSVVLTVISEGSMARGPPELPTELFRTEGRGAWAKVVDECLTLAREAPSLQPGTAQSPATSEMDADEQEAEEKKPTPPRLIVPYDNCAGDDLPLVQKADCESVEFAVPPQGCRLAPQPGDFGTIPDIFHALKDKGVIRCWEKDVVPWSGWFCYAAYVFHYLVHGTSKRRIFQKRLCSVLFSYSNRLPRNRPNGGSAHPFPPAGRHPLLIIRGENTMAAIDSVQPALVERLYE
ncbi:uncharacterized protein N7518_002847 [Penicillium psychrosexuale]|uniref:uncharacterized protein n=1 Tax=Penicillium psychrosexuale TaxID=1002107 RepID=UPI0025453D86|nr:uncharacterized protein N7518_002847 [Penicillium psychrosexuale]KAJ5800779.1 hypothetical protein N7518_002847 [Penicillium psychrosexuale]